MRGKRRPRVVAGVVTVCPDPVFALNVRARRLCTVRQESAKALEAKKLGEAQQAEVSFVFVLLAKLDGVFCPISWCVWWLAGWLAGSTSTSELWRLLWSTFRLLFRSLFLVVMFW